MNQLFEKIYYQEANSPGNDSDLPETNQDDDDFPDDEDDSSDDPDSDDDEADVTD